MSFLYLIRRDGTNRYKVGHSKRPRSRRSDLQMSCPEVLTLLHWRRCANAPALEKIAKEAFAPFRVRGEWFDFPSPGPAADVLDTIASLGRLDEFAEIGLRRLELRRREDAEGPNTVAFYDLWEEDTVLWRRLCEIDQARTDKVDPWFPPLEHKMPTLAGGRP